VFLFEKQAPQKNEIKNIPKKQGAQKIACTNNCKVGQPRFVQRENVNFFFVFFYCEASSFFLFYVFRVRFSD